MSRAAYDSAGRPTDLGTAPGATVRSRTAPGADGTTERTVTTDPLGYTTRVDSDLAWGASIDTYDANDKHTLAPHSGVRFQDCWRALRAASSRFHGSSELSVRRRLAGLCQRSAGDVSPNGYCRSSSLIARHVAGSTLHRLEASSGWTLLLLSIGPAVHMGHARRWGATLLPADAGEPIANCPCTVTVCIWSCQAMGRRGGVDRSMVCPVFGSPGECLWLLVSYLPGF
jgi:hypothetical protein